MKRYSIYLTKQCNCRCLYCYQDNFTDFITDFEIMKETEKILKEVDKHETVIIELIGGEPLLVIDSVMYCYNKLNARLSNATFYISTNLTIVPQQLKQLLQKPNVYIFVSIDGDEEGNSLRVFKNNLYVFDVVSNNIKTLVDMGFENKLITHLVTHFKNVKNLSHHVHFLQSLRVHMVDIGVVEKYHPITKEFCEDFIAQHEIISKGVIKGEFKENINTLLYPPIRKPQTKEQELRYYLFKEVYEQHQERKGGVAKWKQMLQE